MAEQSTPGDRTARSGWETEIERTIRRVRNIGELVAESNEPVVAQSPRQEVYRKHKARLYRYDGPVRYGTPVLFVPNLGISRPTVFDLLPRASFIEYMVEQGFPFYLLDWGVFGPEDDHLTFADCATRILPRMGRKLLAHAEADSCSVVGYCMGAPLAVSFLGTHPDFPVRNLVNLAGPIDFANAGLFGRWLDARYFDVDKLVDTLGQMPAEMVQLGFKLLRPTMDVSTGLNLWWNAWNDRYLESYKALRKWSSEYVPFPGEFFRQWVRDFYQENRLARGTLRLNGRPVDLNGITCPLLVVGAREDNIAPPAAVQALVDLVGSRDKEYRELPGGHISLIAGRSASRDCWPHVASWLAARSHQSAVAQ
ncbi:MAG: alpha/beta fold hydrolase [Chloroflexi bacterium]|nr:alpha/beta fold hydrolase [Chloroflexota bacterium]